MLQDRFVKYLQSEKRASFHTVKAYRADLNNWQQYLAAEFETELPGATRQMVRSWMAWCLSNQISPRTVSRRLSVLKSFYGYLVRTGYRKDNPASTIKPPKMGRRLPEFVKPGQMEELLDSEGIFDDDFSGLRNRLIIELFYATGIRRAELVGLRNADVDWQNLKIKVLGKRNKERIIPVSKAMVAQMHRYMKARNEMLKPAPASHFFLTDSGKPLYPKFVYKLVKSYLQRVSSLKKKSPHVLRHTFATHMLNNGADLNAVKELLGHASLSATQVYTHNGIGELKKIHQQAHPKA